MENSSLLAVPGLRKGDKRMKQKTVHKVKTILFMLLLGASVTPFASSASLFIAEPSMLRLSYVIVFLFAFHQSLIGTIKNAAMVGWIKCEEEKSNDKQK